MRSRIALLLTLVWLGAAAPSAAQRGPVIDDDSPTGKEYAIPLERAREQAAGGGPGGEREDALGERDAPLFGAGVGDDGGGGDRSASSDSTSRPGEQPGEPQPGDASPRRPPLADIEAQVANPDSGTGQMAAIAGGAAGALMLGGAVGLALRRRRSASDDG